MNSENQKDELHRKIGRNLVLLQIVELLLKEILFAGNFILRSNPSDTKLPSIEEQVEKQKGFYQKTMMGCLVDIYSRSILKPLAESPSMIDPNPKTSALSVSFSLGGTTEQQDHLKHELKMIVNRRNKLVHELLVSFDVRTESGITDLDLFLEKQHQEILSILDYLKGAREICKESAKIFFDQSHNLKIPEDIGKVPCVSKLLVCLCLFQYNNTHSDHFEWISLAAAQKDLNHQFPEAIPECRRHFKVKPLKKILRKIGIFDVRSLPTNIDKEMVFYRMKPEYSLREDEGGELYLCSKHKVESGGYFEENVSLKMFLEI